MKPPRICPKCGRKKGDYAHFCPPDYVLRLERAERPAAEIATRRYDPTPSRLLPGKAETIDGLPGSERADLILDMKLKRQLTTSRDIQRRAQGRNFL
jgi:hypothetical protein